MVTYFRVHDKPSMVLAVRTNYDKTACSSETVFFFLFLLQLILPAETDDRLFHFIFANMVDGGIVETPTVSTVAYIDVKKDDCR